MLCAFFAGRQAALLTMHGKERAISPLLAPVFKAEIKVISGFNTDHYGTFSREVPRLGTQIEAARQKAEKAIELSGLEIGLSSEGSFSAHPMLPYLPWNIEIVMLVDKKNELELVGEHGSATTNYAQKTVHSQAQAEEFARQIGFPSHYVMVRPQHASHPELQKDIDTWDTLARAVNTALSVSPDHTVFIETDMRAHANPTRMANISKAAADLAARMTTCCPRCGVPGFFAVRKVRGLPCEWCDSPTEETKAVIHGCLKCAYEEVHGVTLAKASAGRCQHCNP
ncbi:MAG: hypothetical protein KGZ92_07310 [Firmicutes bacterium]|nr:hypothetical protein [Dethiobacter sp.]MBS3889082.1 hypothetical protein [Bacillota bacterium]